MAATFNFIGDNAADQGSTDSWDWQFKTGTLTDPGDIIDYTGYDFVMQVRETESSSTVLFEASITNGKLVWDSTNKKLILTITDEDAASIAAGTYVYQIEINNGAGVIQRLLEGIFKVDAEVVR